MAGPQLITSAALTPCETRKSNRYSNSHAMAHSEKVTTLNANPAVNIRLCPYRSPSLPKTSIRLVCVRT